MEQQPERRKARRFPLQQPVVLQYNNGVGHQLAAQTHNVSLKGALLAAQETIPEESPVEIRMLLQKDGFQDVSLCAMGKVVRQQPTLAGGVAIAVAFDKPPSKA